ncbi:MAG: flagella synthesis protein FlgN [Gammaproteobacteria bacterium]
MHEKTVNGVTTAELLDRQIEALGQMLAGLEAERSALKSRDIEALNVAMDLKTECMAQLESLAAKLGNAPTPTGSDALISERREHIRALSDQCRELNEANGRLITGQQNFVTGALGALGIGAAGHSTYGPDGVNLQREKLRQHHLTA